MIWVLAAKDLVQVKYFFHSGFSSVVIYIDGLIIHDNYDIKQMHTITHKYLDASKLFQIFFKKGSLISFLHLILSKAAIYS